MGVGPGVFLHVKLVLVNEKGPAPKAEGPLQRRRSTKNRNAFTNAFPAAISNGPVGPLE